MLKVIEKMETNHLIRAVSPGIAIGKALKISELNLLQSNRREFNLENELNRFQQMLDRIIAELSDLQETITADIDSRDAEILQTHRLILADNSFQQKVIRLISDERIFIEAAVRQIMEDAAAPLQKSESEYLQARAEDFLDLAKYFLGQPIPAAASSEKIIGGRTILIVTELLPSIVLLAKKRSAAGIVAESGTPVSHAAILARAFGIPVLIGDKNLTDTIAEDDLLIINGFSGGVIIHPEDRTIDACRQRIKENQVFIQQDSRLNKQPAQTIEGTKITLGANIERLDELPLIDLDQIDEIGLFRTEFLYMFDQNDFPGFDQQLTWYRKTIRYMEGRPVTFRILDVGGDKFLSYFSMGVQDNPYLGLRAHRVFQYHPEIFKTQMRAILKAAEGNPVNILYPMINDLQELDFLNQILATVEYDSRNVRIGVMIETPAAVFQIDKIMQQVDFVSIGTNDLVQYTLIVDRNNQNVYRYYQPTHPVILRMIDKIVTAGEKYGKPVSICGEIASDPDWTPLLLGLGLRSFSLSPLLIPMVKKKLQTLTLKDCRELAGSAIKADYVSEVNRLTEEFNRRESNNVFQ